MKKKLLYHAVPLSAIALTGFLLLLFESDFLWKIQEQNLFLCTGLFFREQMVVPGGFLSWAGTYFTQFLFHPWLGVLLLSAWWLLLSWLVVRAFRLSGWWQSLSAVPVLLILVTIVDMGYWVYMLKLPGHFFVTTAGVTSAVALLWGFRCVAGAGKRRFPGWRGVLLNTAFVILSCAAGYPLLGIYGLGAVLLMCLWIWRIEPRWGRSLPVSAAGVASAAVIPLLYYRHVYYQTNFDNIYFAGLPLYYIREEYHTYYIPFYLLLLFFALTMFLPLRPSAVQAAPSSHRRRIPGLQAVVPLCVLAAAVVYAGLSWYRDGNFHRELAMEHCIERLDWEGVLREASAQTDEPTRSIVMMRNIALARLGRQGDEMFRYRNGSKRSDAPFDMRMMLVCGPTVYYHYGMVNSCYRLSMEMGVEFGWRAENVKYMARCAVLNGEWQLARKYIGILRQTTFFGEWADNLSLLIEKPSETGRSPEMGFITHMMHYKNELTSDQGYVESFVMKHLTANTDTTDAIFQEQALLASMQTRNEKMFWRHLSNYVRLHPGRQLPVHVQEAALLLGTLEERPGIDEWPFDRSVRESCRSFCEIMPRFDNMEVGPVRTAMAPQFGQTFYYDYFLMDKLPEY